MATTIVGEEEFDVTRESDASESKREQLERYIRESRKTQRQLAVACVLGAAIAGMAWMNSSAAGMWALLITAFIGGTGYYITGMHIQGWQQELYDMRQLERKQRRARG